ncbi:hypothetical protein [Petrachloros mirabilis]
MRNPIFAALVFSTVFGIASSVNAEGELLIYAVVSEEPKDKTQVPAKVSISDVVSDSKLFVPDTIANNPVWRTLEICHAVRLEGTKTSDGIKVLDAKIINASMLPMSLQAFAGDCLIKKALNVAPMVD